MSEHPEIKCVKELGERIGYGHMMSVASALWSVKLREGGLPIEGAFVPTITPFLTEEGKRNSQPVQEIYMSMVENENKRSDREEVSEC